FATEIERELRMLEEYVMTDDVSDDVGESLMIRDENFEPPEVPFQPKPTSVSINAVHESSVSSHGTGTNAGSSSSMRSTSHDDFPAVLFHDAIYDPLAGDNEARSAEVAARFGASERACDLIRLTARHGKLSPADVDRDAALFLDCDTQILATEPAVFDAYDA